MERLTDKELAKALKSNCEGLKRAGIEPNMSDLRYIKLAEYENAAEHIEIVTNAPALSYQVAMIKQLMDDEPKDETKWAKNNPSLNVDGKSINDMIMRRFMERR